MIEQLRAATRELHTEIESNMYTSKLMEGHISPKELNHLLAVNYLFFDQIENHIAVDSELQAFVPQRARYAKADLLANQDHLPENPPKILEVDYQNKSDVAGVLYVALGSSLGGTYIAKSLQRMPQFDGVSFTFYENARREIACWDKFKVYLSGTNLIPSSTTSAAVAAFKYFDYLRLRTEDEEYTGNR